MVEFDHHGEEKRVTIEFGVVPVRLQDIPDKLLHMVVVRGFGKQPMMLLTTLAKNTSREALWQVVEGSITRWRVEDTIRHVKQSYKLEDIRLFKYGKLKAMTAEQYYCDCGVSPQHLHYVCGPLVYYSDSCCFLPKVIYTKPLCGAGLSIAIWGNHGETLLVSCYFSLHTLIFFHLPDSTLPVRHEVMQLPLP